MLSVARLKTSHFCVSGVGISLMAMALAGMSPQAHAAFTVSSSVTTNSADFTIGSNLPSTIDIGPLVGNQVNPVQYHYDVYTPSVVEYTIPVDPAFQAYSYLGVASGIGPDISGGLTAQANNAVTIIPSSGSFHTKDNVSTDLGFATTVLNDNSLGAEIHGSIVAQLERIFTVTSTYGTAMDLPVSYVISSLSTAPATDPDVVLGTLPEQSVSFEGFLADNSIFYALNTVTSGSGSFMLSMPAGSRLVITENMSAKSTANGTVGANSQAEQDTQSGVELTVGSPEPTSLGLVAVGGLLLLARRKRK